MTVDWEESDGTEWREELKQLKGNVSIDALKILDEFGSVILITESRCDSCDS